VAPADGKAVAAIEKLIGQSIPWMGEPPTAAETAAPPDGQREARGGRHQGRGPRQNAPRREQPREQQREQPREQPPASVTHIEEARPRLERKPAGHERPRQEPPQRDDPALSHLPAFLLRPVRVKA
jgi:hypothetical protein